MSAAKVRADDAYRATDRLLLEIMALQAEEVPTQQGLARALTERRVATPRGVRRWTRMTVERLVERVAGQDDVLAF